MHYDTVLFDFDGVVAETPDRAGLRAAFQRTCDRFADALPDDTTASAFLDGDFEAITEYCRDLDVDPGRFCAQATVETIRTQWRAFERGCRSRYKDAAAVRQLDAPLGVVSDNHPTVVSLLLQRFGLAAQFETVRGCSLTPDGLARRKPNPANIEAAMDELGASTALYVGDRDVDVEAASRAGIDSVLLARGEDSTTANATHRLSSLRELPAIVE